jgi:hypothetical protein
MRVIDSGKVVVVFVVDLSQDLGLIIDGDALAEDALDPEVLLVIVEEVD